MKDILKNFTDDDDGRLSTYKSNLYFPPRKKINSSLKAKPEKQKEPTKSLPKQDKPKIAKFAEKNPQKFDSKSQFVKEKRKGKAYSSSSEKQLVHSKSKNDKEINKFKSKESKSEISLKEKKKEKKRKKRRKNI